MDVVLVRLNFSAEVPTSSREVYQWELIWWFQLNFSVVVAVVATVFLFEESSLCFLFVISMK